jgi:hypothetical protein
VKAKASPNKNWGWTRWNRLAWILQERHGVRVTQLGGLDTPLPRGRRARAHRFVPPSVRGARDGSACVLPEGGLHHAAAALGVPAVVIFGGFIAPRHTGYAAHVNLFTGGEACGMRLPCDHCRDGDGEDLARGGRRTPDGALACFNTSTSGCLTASSTFRSG